MPRQIDKRTSEDRANMNCDNTEREQLPRGGRVPGVESLNTTFELKRSTSTSILFAYFDFSTFWKCFCLCKTLLNKTDQEPGFLNHFLCLWV